MARFLLPHLPLDREPTPSRWATRWNFSTTAWSACHRVRSTLSEGEAEGVKSPTEVGTGKAKDEKAPLSEIIEVLNERFGTQFTEEDRLFFQQIKEKAVRTNR